MVGRFLQRNGEVTTLGADSGEEVAGNIFVAVTSFRECEDVGDFKVLSNSCQRKRLIIGRSYTHKCPATRPSTITPSTVDGLFPPLAQIIPVAEFWISLTVQELRTSNSMDTAANDIVPGAIVASQKLIKVLILEDERVSESSHVQRVSTIRSAGNDRTLPDFCEVGTSIR